MARSRSASLTAQNTFSDPVFAKKGGRYSLSGTWVATVSLQRKVNGTWTDVTNSSGTAITHTGNGTFDISPNEVLGEFRVGIKTGNYTSGTVVIFLEGK